MVENEIIEIPFQALETIFVLSHMETVSAHRSLSADDEKPSNSPCLNETRHIWRGCVKSDKIVKLCHLSTVLCRPDSWNFKCIVRQILS